MRNSMILAGAAALALAGPAFAQGKGNGGGGPKNDGGPAKVERGGGGGPKADRGPQVQRGGGGMRVERGPAQAQRGGGGERRIERQKQSRGAERREVRVDRKPDRVERQRPVREAREQQVRGRDRRDVVEVRDVRGIDTRDRLVIRNGRDGALPINVASIGRTGLIDGCPPGLAAKNNGCLPPGQAKRLVGAAVPAALASSVLPPLYRSWYPDNDDYFFRADDGYVYRIDRDRNLVDGYFPLYNDWTGAYYVGATYPSDYLDYYNVPVQYQPFYADSDDYYYRYGDGAIYRVNPNGGVLDSVVSLLAGDFAVGQPLPLGYDAYNVPYAYRDRYADTSDAWYRYNDGYIYEVDPTTRLVQAIVQALV